MSAERTPPTNENFLSRPFGRLTRLVIAWPRATLIVGGALAAASVLLAATRLGFHTSRQDLLSHNNEYNRRWEAYTAEFGAADDAVIVVEGASRDEVIPALDAVSAAVSREPRLFRSVLAKVDLSAVRAKGCYHLSVEELTAVEQFVAEVEPIVRDGWSRLNLLRLLTGGAGQSAAPEGNIPTGQRERLDGLLSGLHAALRGEEYRSPWMASPSWPKVDERMLNQSSRYLLANDGRFGFVLLKLAEEENGELARGNEPIDKLRQILAEVSAQRRGVTIGLTGLPIIENDEMRSSQTSMFWAGAVSLVGVIVVIIAGFGGVRHTVLANVILLVGMAWSFGFATLAVGHLNILSITFTATLIGIGIDYGTYFIARYVQLRSQGRACDEALIETAESVSPAITTGAVTTAVAFFCAGLTSFSGVAELGVIAGGGILLCAAAELALLPAAIHLVDRGRLGRRTPTPLPIHTWGRPFARRLKPLVVVCLVGTAALAWGSGQLWYDNNLLHLQPEGIESVAWEHKLLTECDQNVWYAVSVAGNREQLMALKERFERLPTVQRTEEAASMMPINVDLKRPTIERVQHRLRDLPFEIPLIPVDPPERLAQALAGMGQSFAAAPDLAPLAARIDDIRRQFAQLPLDEAYRRLSAFQQGLAGDLLRQMQTLRAASNPEPPRWADLPRPLVDRFIGQNGRYLLKVYGRGNIWDHAALTRFVHDLRTVDPDVTGNPLQAYEASLEMRDSYDQAALYALVVILCVLLLDFRNVRDALLAAAPLALGLAQTAGIMGWLDMPLNPANLIALPLILGIGIDYGVHIVHEFHGQVGRYRMSQATAVAVLVDSLTTIVGFGALMLASHRGLQSLGRVLTIGVTCCTFSSLVILPAALSLWTRRREEKAEHPPSPPVEPERRAVENDEPTIIHRPPPITFPPAPLPPAPTPA